MARRLIGWVAWISLGSRPLRQAEGRHRRNNQPSAKEARRAARMSSWSPPRVREEFAPETPPTAVSVVSDETISTAPGQTLPDLLRAAIPGINVAQTSARDVNVNSRSAAGTLSDSAAGAAGRPLDLSGLLWLCRLGFPACRYK
jgi:hypothetical protein